MTITDIRYGGVIGRVVAAVICLVVCSRSSAADSTREALTNNIPQQEATLPLERVSVMVPLGHTNCASTQMLFFRSSPPPWQRGNYLTFTFRKATVPGQMEQWVSWRVVNIHADNYFEITRRLKMSSVEVRVLHTGASLGRVQAPGQPERAITTDKGYAVVTDARIPREWYLSEPGGNMGTSHFDDWKTARVLRAAYPESFRVNNVGVNDVVR